MLARKARVLSVDGEVAADALAVQAQRELQGLQFPNKAIEALANYAAVQLSEASEPRDKRDWWDRALAAAKTATSRGTDNKLASKREKLRKLGG